jgi:hypothetical protein
MTANHQRKNISNCPKIQNVEKRKVLPPSFQKTKVFNIYSISIKSYFNSEKTVLLYILLANSSFMFSLFGVEWVMPQTALNLLTTWGASFGHGLVKKAWRLVPHCVLWSIWRERNARLFEDVETVMVVSVVLWAVPCRVGGEAIASCILCVY